MAGKVDLYNLGAVGVINTTSPVHGPDGALQSAQNAVPDTRGQQGAITKRDGLTAINSSSAGGTVKGVVNVGLLTTATVYVGTQNGSGLSNGWYKTTDAFATQPLLIDDSGGVGTVGVPHRNSGKANMIFLVNGENDKYTGVKAVVWQNKLYYAVSDLIYTQGTDSPPIYVFDGTFDREFVRVPVNPDAGQISYSMTHIMAEGNYLYVATHDAGDNFATHKGSVYRVDPVSGAILKLGATFPTGYVPFCLIWYQGRLWAGTYSEDSTKSGRVYTIRPGIDSAWTLDHTTTAGQGEVISMAVYNGNLYIGTRGSSGAAGLVKKRDSAGTWTTSQTGPSTSAIQGYVSLCVFGSNLYASYFDDTNNTWQIEKFNDSSWSTVNSGATEDMYYLFTDGTTLYALDGSMSGTATLLVSTNGTSWTARSTGSWSSPAAQWQTAYFGVMVL